MKGDIEEVLPLGLPVLAGEEVSVAARDVMLFENLDAKSFATQGGGGSEPTKASTDHDGVAVVHALWRALVGLGRDLPGERLACLISPPCDAEPAFNR